MPKPFDVTTKHLIEAYPLDWLRWLGLPLGKVRLIDADLSTLIAEADKLIQVDAEEPYIAHIETQASYKPNMAERFMVYNALEGLRTGLPVVTIVFLLRPEADGACMRQPFVKRFQGNPFLQFDFRVVRVWEESAESFLEGGMGLLPLAPLCNIKRAELPELTRRMERRIEAESEDPATMYLATDLLMGLRYEEAFVRTLLKGVSKMRESVTYQAIIAEGEAIGEARGEARGELKLLLLFGRKRLGEPDSAMLAALQAITNAETIEGLANRLSEVETWDELLAGL